MSQAVALLTRQTFHIQAISFGQFCGLIMLFAFVHDNKKMKNQKVWGWSIGALAVLVFSSVVWPLILNSKRPKNLSFKVRQVFVQAAKVEQALVVSSMTRDFVVTEGPCAGNGCNGGILTQQFSMDVKDMIPDLKGYDDATTTIIWLYQVKPEEVTRKNDLFGGDTVTITGHLTKEPKFYFAIVPKQIVEPRLQWVFVETK